MMTPEQMQNTMQFIVENHANAMIRMDRLDEDLKRQGEEIASLLEVSRNQIGHNSNVEQSLKAITEILASQAIRLQWLEERGR
jgi:muramidase (phage lysozyme)